MRAASAAAEPPLEPRVADLVGRPPGGELVRVGVSHEDHAALAQPPPGGAVSVADAALEDAARGGQRQPACGEEVLEREWDAAQGRRDF
jgi:hypothetical protein